MIDYSGKRFPNDVDYLSTWTDDGRTAVPTNTSIDIGSSKQPSNAG
jgi:hypothetical protein